MLLLSKRGNIGAANLDKAHENCSVCDIFTTMDIGYLPIKYFLETKTTNRTE